MRTSLTSLATLALVASGCADHVPTDTNACPCATGYVCCASGVCAPDEASCGAATAALSSAARGKWVGYIENFDGLASGSDRVELELTVGTDGQLEGHAIIGEGPPPPPPTVADQSWPRQFTSSMDLAIHPWVSGAPMDGFAYSALNIRWQARRLRFEAHYSEPWGPWCALQTPNLATQDSQHGGHLCADSSGGVGGPDESYHCYLFSTGMTVDCGYVFLCSDVQGPAACQCTETACTAASPLPTIPQMRFDLDLQGNEAEGSLDWLGGPSNVRLIRASR